MRRLRLEILRFLEARDLLLGIGLADFHWHESSEEEEVWRGLLAADFGENPKAASRFAYQKVWRSRCYAVQMCKPCLQLYRLPSMSLICSIPAKPTRDRGSDDLFGICYLRSGSLLISGGRDRCVSFKQVFEVNLQENALIPLNDMCSERYGHGTVQVGRDVYCFGGSTDPLVGHANSTAEKYNLDTGNWTCLPNMLSHRMLFAPAKLHKKVYIIGGCWTRHSELYDALEGSFHALTLSNPFSISPCCSIAISGSLYLFGESGVWQWTFASNEPLLTQFASFSEEESLPFGFLASVRVRKQVFLYGGDQSVYQFSLDDGSIRIALEFASSNCEYAEEETDYFTRETHMKEGKFSVKTRDFY